MSSRLGILGILLITLVATLSIGCGGDDDDDSATTDDETGGADDDTSDDDSFDDDTDDDSDDDDVDDDTDDDVDDDSDDDADDDVDDDADDDTQSDPSTDDPDVHLCDEWEADPEDLEDPVNIHCLIETGAFGPEMLETPDHIRVVTWNILRGFTVDDLIEQFQDNAILSEADVVFMQEVDRHCPRTDGRNIARDIAEGLGMNYVYTVEFVELNQNRCEHGNALFTRYPIVSFRQHRFTDFEKWYQDTGEPRLGGRIAVRADIDLGDRYLRAASAHFTSGVDRYFHAHQVQAAETLDFVDGPADIVWGGDLNTGVYWVLPPLETSIGTILDAGYPDAFEDRPRDEVWTYSYTDWLRARLDWIWARGPVATDGDVLRDPPLDTLSDHLGVWADFALP